MSDYSNFPPYKYFSRILKNCPKSALIYIQIWKLKNARMVLVIEKIYIRKDFLLSPTMFRNLITPLMYMGIIKFIEDSKEYRITLNGICDDI